MKSKLNIIAIAAVTILNSLICGNVNAKPLPQLDLKNLTEPIIPENSVYGVLKIKTLGSLPADTTCEDITVEMVSERQQLQLHFRAGIVSEPLFIYSKKLSGGWIINTSVKETTLPADCYYLITPKKDELGEKVSLYFFGRSFFCPLAPLEPLTNGKKYFTLGASKQMDFTMELGCIRY
jgi:hypothetical protein